MALSVAITRCRWRAGASTLTRINLLEVANRPYGAKAVGEIATVPVAPTLINAVNAALGTRLTDLPLLPERIISALQN